MRKNEAEGGAVRCPGSHSKLVAKSGLELRLAEISPLKESLLSLWDPLIWGHQMGHRDILVPKGQ